MEIGEVAVTLNANETRENAEDDNRWSFYCAASIVQKEVNPQHWMAFWLTAVDGKSAEGVASQLSMKTGTVYSAKCRVLSKLKTVIESLATISPNQGVGK